MLNKKIKISFKKGNWDFFKSVFLVTAVLLGTAYFMQHRVQKVMQKARDKRSLASGLEYFVRNFQFSVADNKPFKIGIFKKKAVVVNYLLDADPDSKKLFQSQLELFKKLKMGIIFLYVIDENFDVKNFVSSFEYDSDIFMFVNDINKSKQLLPIKKLPYSLVLSNEHHLVAQVDGYQNWNTEEKFSFLKNISSTVFTR